MGDVETALVTQETGFSEWLPTGDGLFSFRTPEEALAALAEVDRRYEHHCQAARALCEAHFDSDKVLGRLVELAMAGS